MSILEVNDINFEAEVLGSSLPVLVDVWASWCGPCKTLAPILQEFSKNNSHQIKVVKVNSDNSPEVKTKYNIKGLPTLLLFQNGKLIGTKTGLIALKTLNKWVSDLLSSV